MSSQGTWTDAYTGEQMTFTDLHDPAQARAIPVDHRVSLASAWRYGASKWNDRERLQFANDLDNLQPTTQRTNAAKGGDDAARGGHHGPDSAVSPLATLPPRSDTGCRSIGPKNVP